jgi:hypothetical protein
MYTAIARRANAKIRLPAAIDKLVLQFGKENDSALAII